MSTNNSRFKVKHIVTVRSIATHMKVDIRTVILRAKKLGMHNISGPRGERSRLLPLSETRAAKLMSSLYQDPPVVRTRGKKAHIPAENVNPWDL